MHSLLSADDQIIFAQVHNDTVYMLMNLKEEYEI